MKGQNLRLFFKESGTSGGTKKPIAKAQECSYDSDVQTESDASKDTTGDWEHVQVTGKSYSMSASCDFDTNADTGAWTVAAILNLLGTNVDFDFAEASGDKNRTAGSAVISGTAMITKVSISSVNRQKITASLNFVGQGAPS